MIFGNGHAEANVVDLAQYMTHEQIAQGIEPGTPLWWLTECCMQAQGWRGLFSDECKTPEMTELLANGACQALGAE